MNKRIKKLIVILGVFFLALSLIRLLFTPGTRTGPLGIGLPSSMGTFIGETTGIHIEYPESWTAFETPQGSNGDLDIVVAILVPGRSFPSLWISRKTFLIDDLFEVAKWGEQKIQNLNGYVQISFDVSKINDREGLIREYQLEYSSLLRTILVNCQDYYFLDNQIGYRLSFCAETDQWSHVESVFAQMVASFFISKQK